MDFSYSVRIYMEKPHRGGSLVAVIIFSLLYTSPIGATFRIDSLIISPRWGFALKHWIFLLPKGRPAGAIKHSYFNSYTL